MRGEIAAAAAQAAGASEAFPAGVVIAVVAVIAAPFVRPLTKSHVVDTADAH